MKNEDLNVLSYPFSTIFFHISLDSSLNRMILSPPELLYEGAIVLKFLLRSESVKKMRFLQDVSIDVFHPKDTKYSHCMEILF